MRISYTEVPGTPEQTFTIQTLNNCGGDHVLGIITYDSNSETWCALYFNDEGDPSNLCEDTLWGLLAKLGAAFGVTLEKK